MKNKTPRETKVTIENHYKGIRIRFTLKGKTYSFSTALKYVDENIHIAELKKKKIQQDIKSGHLDDSLNTYREMIKTRSYYTVADKAPDSCYNFHTIYLDYVIHLRKKRKITTNELPVNFQMACNLLQSWDVCGLSEIEEKLWERKYAPSTHNHRLYNLKNFFDWGMKNGLFPYNPLSDTEKLKVKRQTDKTRLPLSKEEIENIFYAMKTNMFCSDYSSYKHSFYLPFLKFMVYTGVRNAEAIGLLVEKVDLKNRTITIDQALARNRDSSIKGPRIRKETKTGNVRVLPMNNELYELLSKACKDKKPTDLVFQSYKGKSICDRMFQQRVFKPVLEGLGIPKRVLYALRHSFAERALLQGMSPYEVATLMGHSNLETTFRNYVHLIQSPKNLPGL